MSTQDDPEARIQEVRSSPGEQASDLTQRSARWGPGQYEGHGAAVPPHPAPIPTYPAPVSPNRASPPPAPPTVIIESAGRKKMFRSVATMLAVGAVAFVVFFVLAMGKSFIGSRTTTPTVADGAGPIPQMPISEPVGPPAPIGQPSVSDDAPGGNISVSGVSETETIDCKDSVVEIGGVSNTVVLVGHCMSVAVSGVENVVTVDAADIITASGQDNEVTYRSGSPDVQNSSSSNVVEQG